MMNPKQRDRLACKLAKGYLLGPKKYVSDT